MIVIKERIVELIKMPMVNNCDTLEKLAEAILNLRYENGEPMLAILDENQKLPRYPLEKNKTNSVMAYHRSQKDMLSQGWKKVKEVKEDGIS